MKTGIVVYSETGNTLGIAEALKERLSEAGKDADILQIRADKRRRKLEASPEVEGYDYLVFGAPVHAFTVARPMKLFLKRLSSTDVRVGIYVTQAAIGKTIALRRMRKMLKKKGASVITGDGVSVALKKGREQTETVLERLMP